MYKQPLLNKIKNKSALVSVVGLGYVGLPLLLRFAEVGFRVLGFDVDTQKLETLRSHRSYIQHIPHERIARLAKQLEFSADYQRFSEADVCLLCLPTPLTKHREPDLSYVLQTLKQAKNSFRPGQLICLESTTYPGTTEEVLKPALEASGFIVGNDCFIVFSPEREDPGNPQFNTANIPKVCGGLTPHCLELGVALYQQIVEEVVPVSQPKVAEMAKLLENIHRAVNIGLVNEMKVLCHKMGIDIYEVIRAAATKPFGFVPYFPGPGIGGHCIPIDPFYLTWKAREYGMHTRFIELAGEINQSMPQWVIEQLVLALNERSKPIKSSRILVLGISYKPNVDDMRESPSVALMEILRKRGANIAYSDPFVPVFPSMREHHFELNSVALTPKTLSEFDAVIVATAHRDVDYDLIKQQAKLIIDTRGVYPDAANNIVKA